MEAKDEMIQLVFEFTGKYISDREAEQLIQSGIKEVVEVAKRIFYIESDGEIPRLYLWGNGYKGAEIWQAYKKSKGIT